MEAAPSPGLRGQRGHQASVKPGRGPWGPSPTTLCSFPAMSPLTFLSSSSLSHCTFVENPAPLGWPVCWVHRIFWTISLLDILGDFQSSYTQISDSVSASAFMMKGGEAIAEFYLRVLGRGSTPASPHPAQGAWVSVFPSRVSLVHSLKTH